MSVPSPELLAALERATLGIAAVALEHPVALNGARPSPGPAGRLLRLLMDRVWAAEFGDAPVSALDDDPEVDDEVRAALEAARAEPGDPGSMAVLVPALVEAPVLPWLKQANLRREISRGCKATGTPLWSPHDLRRRRISLWHRDGVSWAQIGEWVGQHDISTTANIYTRVIVGGEIDRASFLPDAAALVPR